MPRILIVGGGYDWGRIEQDDIGPFDSNVKLTSKSPFAKAGLVTDQKVTTHWSMMAGLAEAYPDLKASANFQSLQHELADVEDKLAAARRALNAAVARFNGARESFPAVLFAGALGFAEADFHRLDASEQGTVDQVPKIGF